MKKYVPVAKQTKKMQKSYYSQHRRNWNGVNPMTQTMPNGRAYNRKKMKQQDRRCELNATICGPVCCLLNEVRGC